MILCACDWGSPAITLRVISIIYYYSFFFIHNIIIHNNFLFPNKKKGFGAFLIPFFSLRLFTYFSSFTLDRSTTAPPIHNTITPSVIHPYISPIFHLLTLLPFFLAHHIQLIIHHKMRQLIIYINWWWVFVNLVNFTMR